MDIILVYLGEKIPSYITTCIEQIRYFTNDRIVLVLSHAPRYHFDPSDNITVVIVESLEKQDDWKRFKEVNHLKKYDNPGNVGAYTYNNLWESSCERFYVIEAVMDMLAIENALHMEVDNLIYDQPDSKFLESYCGKAIGLTQITETLASANVMYIGSRESLRTLNGKLNDLMEAGDYTNKYGDEMMNEMRMLKIISDENHDLISYLPTFPTKESQYIYDCISWGQYIGGTIQIPDKSFAHDSHLVSREINKGTYDVVWKMQNDFKFPYVLDKTKGEIQPLFILHIHSKNLERWKSK